MFPDIRLIKQLPPDQSVICLIINEVIPEWLKLSADESAYVSRCLADETDVIFLNSYYRLNILVIEKKNGEASKKDEELRRAAVKVADILKENKKGSVTLASEDTNSHSVMVFGEALILAIYTFSKYIRKKSNSNEVYLNTINFLGGLSQDDLHQLKSITKSVWFARDMVNEPLNHLSSTDFANTIKSVCEDAGAKVENYGIKRIESLKMGGLLAVNQGSIDPPAFSIIEWKPEGAVNKKPVVLVGKGVVFDTGGINLKPTGYLEDMKSDMAGGAAVAAVMSALALSKLNIYVVGLVPITDNRPGKNAIVPGDIITMFNGSTVEVLNTDAEGRLILADALAFAGKYKPALVLSIATLTGSAQNAFGSQAIAVMGNAVDEIFNMLGKGGEEVYERIAMMPFFDEYGEMMKSDIADLKNLGEKKAGAITAGKFLENFTDAPYIHLDIAGTAMLEKKEHYKPKGGTGSGVRLLMRFLQILAENPKSLNT